MIPSTTSNRLGILVYKYTFNTSNISKNFFNSILAHSRFRGSVNCGAPSMEYTFQFAKFSFEV